MSLRIKNIEKQYPFLLNFFPSLLGDLLPSSYNFSCKVISSPPYRLILQAFLPTYKELDLVIYF